jgi:hypothetical protein
MRKICTLTRKYLHAETPRLANKAIVFSEHEVFKVVVMVTRRIFLQMKNPLKISLLIILSPLFS